MNHTKGKWFSHNNGTYIELRSDCPDGELLSWTAIGDVCASKYSEVGDLGAENASRIIDCVNACDGIDNPASDIAKLRRERDELLKELDVLSNGYHGNRRDVGLVQRLVSARKLVKKLKEK